MKSSKELEYFVENLSMLLGSGMPILSALTAIHSELRSKKVRRVVQILQKEIESGSPIWKAINKTHVFPMRTISLIRVGEETGKLSENLKVLALQEEKERLFRSKVRSTLLYPSFVLVLSVVIGLLMAWFILPRLATAFSHLGAELPFITKILINMGTFIGSYGVIFLPVSLVVFGSIVYFVFFYPKIRSIRHTLFFTIPIVKNLIREIEIARFGYLLGTLLDAGLPITHALNSLEESTISTPYKKLYTHLQTAIEEGNSFKKSFSLYHKANVLIPVTIQKMISVGEQSGNLTDALLNIGRIFERRIENTTKNLEVVLEPILLVLVGIVVLIVLLAIYLPVYGFIAELSR